MAALLKLPVSTAPITHTIPDDMRRLLNRIRFYASICRASAYLDIFDACAVLDPNSDKAEDAQIRILIRVMGQALQKRPIFLRPGEASLSFDEDWLIAALSARVSGDNDSFIFLMHRRVAKDKRWIFGMIISGLVEILTEKL